MAIGTQMEDMPVVSIETVFGSYGVTRLWA